MSEELNISNLSEDTGSGKTISSKEDLGKRKFVLRNKTIGISISESENLKELGYSLPHLKDVIIESARYVLSLGGKIAYGGDMRNGGFTELILDLLMHYKTDDGLSPNKRFSNYLAWPIYLNLSRDKEIELVNTVSFIKVTPPETLQIDNPNEFLKPDSSESLYVWSQCLTEMRNKMASECDARIFIGGKTHGFKSICPGILQELIITIENNSPVYLVGAFGGITQDCIDVLNEIENDRFDANYYFSDKAYEEFYLLHNNKNKEKPIDYETMKNTISDMGWKGLSNRNGLSVEDNKRLAETPHITEIIYLIIKGLTRKFAI